MLMSKELFDKSNNNRIRQNGLIMPTDEVVDLLNSQSELISAYQYEFVKMKKENEQLREELSECEKFRYSVFKRIEKTIEDKDNCVLNKNAKSPCKAYDECLKRQGTNKPLPCIVNWMMGRPFENMLRKEEDIIDDRRI